MFLPKFVLKGNLQARTRVPPPHSRPGVRVARGDVCHAAPGHGPPRRTRVCSRTKLLRARVMLTRVLGRAREVNFSAEGTRSPRERETTSGHPPG